MGIQPHSFRNCPLGVWRFSPTRQYLICHRSGRLGDRVGYTLDFKLYHYPHEHTGDFKDKLGAHLLDLRCLLFRRRCDGGHPRFSKKLENHEHSLALYFMHYNFCRIHQTLRVTPAMEAGITDHVLSLDEVIDLP